LSSGEILVTEKYLKDKKYNFMGIQRRNKKLRTVIRAAV
jgi:hypothetical protein